MRSRLLLTLVTPALLGLPLAGCYHDDDHYYHAHHRAVVRETVVAEPTARQDYIIVDEGGRERPMPPLREEVITVRPSHEAVWHPGHWVREPHRWVWVN